jgi:hypothetical protein
MAAPEPVIAENLHRGKLRSGRLLLRKASARKSTRRDHPIEESSIAEGSY